MYLDRNKFVSYYFRECDFIKNYYSYSIMYDPKAAYAGLTF